MSDTPLSKGFSPSGYDALNELENGQTIDVNQKYYIGSNITNIIAPDRNLYPGASFKLVKFEFAKSSITFKQPLFFNEPKAANSTIDILDDEIEFIYNGFYWQRSNEQFSGVIVLSDTMSEITISNTAYIYVPSHVSSTFQFDLVGPGGDGGDNTFTHRDWINYNNGTYDSEYNSGGGGGSGGHLIGVEPAINKDEFILVQVGINSTEDTSIPSLGITAHHGEDGAISDVRGVNALGGIGGTVTNPYPTGDAIDGVSGGNGGRYEFTSNGSTYYTPKYYPTRGQSMANTSFESGDDLENGAGGTGAGSLFGNGADNRDNATGYGSAGAGVGLDRVPDPDTLTNQARTKGRPGVIKIRRKA